MAARRARTEQRSSSRRAASDWLTVAQAYNKRSSSKYSNITIHPGDRVHLIAPGGGGYGNPADRDPAAIREDILEGYVSRQQAEADYGYRVTGED